MPIMLKKYSRRANGKAILVQRTWKVGNGRHTISLCDHFQTKLVCFFVFLNNEMQQYLI